MKNSILKNMTATAMLTAVAVILSFISFPIIPVVGFLKYDFCDIIILIISFAFGPLYAIGSSLIFAMVQALLPGNSGIYGFVMNVISTLSFVIPASLIYIKHKTKKNAIVALFVGCITMNIVMVAFNYLITPYFMGLPLSAMHTYIPYIILFNLIKTVVNSVITFLIYKHINNLIKKYNN